MKKTLMMILTVITVSLSAVPSMTHAEADDERSVGLIINEQWFKAKQPPILKNDRTLAPLREISEALDFKVAWEQDDKKVTVSKDDVSFDLFIDRSYIIKDGKESAIDSPPILWYDTTMVPVRLISEMLSCDVEWDGERYLVFVNSPKKYNYYKNTPHVINTYYQNEETELTGHIEKIEYYSDAYSMTDPIKTAFHLITDNKSNYVYDLDGNGNMVTCENTKRVELDCYDTNIDFEPYIGKRVTLKGMVMPPAASWATADVRLFIDSIELNEIN